MLKNEAGSRNLSPDEAALWERYVARHDDTTRGEVIERYLGTAQKLAAIMYSHRPDDSVEFGDYLQYARIGLLEAIDRYDPVREASFTTFASYRIRGAIINGVEKATELAMQRAQRRRLRRERLKSLKDHEVARDQFARMVDLTLSLAVGYLLEESGIWNADEPDRAADPYVSLEMKRLAERLALLVNALPEREALIIRQHYFEHREFVEIADSLGISKGRVSQLHARALKLLRQDYTEAERVDRKAYV